MEISLLTLLIILAVIFLCYMSVTKNFYYFCDKPVASLKPTIPIINTFLLLFEKFSFFDLIDQLYKPFPNSKIIGTFNLLSPMWVVRDPDTVKKMFVKDFDHFVDHQSFIKDFDQSTNEVDALFTNSLFLLKQQKWRDMRATLSPAFTGSKMRLMFELVRETAKAMSTHFVQEAKTNGRQVHEMKDVFSRFTNDVIASCAFGIKVDSFAEKENSFFTMAKKMSFRPGKLMTLKFTLFMMFPKVMQKLNMSIFDRDMAMFFKQIIRDTIQTREKHNIVRPDMINLLMQLKTGSNISHEQENKVKDAEGFATVEESAIGKSTTSRVWTETELIAQCFLFFLAGFETASTFLQFLSHELVVNTEVQQKLYEEIKSFEEGLEGKPLSYDDIQKMKYLDMVITEGLRKWPPAPVIDRECVKDYVYDEGNGVKFTIEKGQLIWIPIFSYHMDPKYFPNPEKFDPERFSDENKDSIHPGAYLPFGVGPRNCIGSRFALMEVKAVIYYLLLNFSFEVCEKTQIPLKLRSGFGMFAEKGVWVDLKLRK
uniref:Putative cytochrome n=1 Tax=Corethrella appendiculata TaxID=1370023 RepID=U5EYB7_9DIPT